MGFSNTHRENGASSRLSRYADGDLLTRICQAIWDKKGFNILVLDVKDVCTLTDYFILAEGNVDRHVQALAHSIINTMAELHHSPLHVEGMAEGDWLVLDYSDIVVHLFAPDWREKYALESLWKEGRLVNIPFILK